MEISQFLDFAGCLPEPVLLVAQNGRLLAGNAAAYNLLQPNSNELNGQLLADYVQETPRQLQRYLQACVDSDAPVIGCLTHRDAPNHDSPKNNSAERNHLCYGRALQPHSAESAVLLRCTSIAVEHGDFQALGLQIDSLQQEIIQHQQLEARFLIAEAMASVAPVGEAVTIVVKLLLQPKNKSQ